MPLSQTKLSKITAVAAAIVVTASLLLPPGVYSFIVYSNLAVDMTADALVAADGVERVIAQSPRLWTFQEVRLEELMSRHAAISQTHANERVRIVDSQDKLVAAVANPPAAPVIARSVPLFDAGQQVGRLEIQRSLRPLLVNAAWLSLFGLMLAAGSFVSLRVLPLRAVLGANDSLRRRTEELLREIEERKRAQAALQESEQIIEAVLNSVPARIFWKDKNLVYLGCNAAFARDAGFARPEDVVGKDDYQMGWRDQANLYRGDDRKVIESGLPKLLIDEPQTTPEGKVITLLTSKIPLQSSNGEITGVLGMYMDVTERERAAEAVRQSEARFKAIFDNARDGILLVDAGSKKVASANDRFCAMLGYSHDELTKLAVADLHPAEVVPDILKEFEQRTRGKTGELVDIPVKRKDGSKFFADINAAPFTIGEKGYVLGIFRDITERKLAAEKLEQRDNLLHAVAFSATEFLTAPTLEEAMPRALELVSKTIRADRINILESVAASLAAPILRYLWQASDIAIPIDARFFQGPGLVTAEIVAWQAPAIEGKTVVAQLETSSRDMKAMMQRIGAKTILLVPIMIDGKHWGHIGIDSCKAERSWEDFEIEILRTLADLIGNAIRRERYVKEIANANRIVQNTPTILYRMRGEPSLPMIYISQNIKLFGHEPAALMASPGLYQSLIHPDDIARVRTTMAETMERGEPRGVNEFRLLTSHGEYRWVENRYTPIRDAANRLIEIEGLLFDVTERKAAEEKIAKLARTDALTGLPNRSTFIDRLQQTFAAARRGASSFAVFYLDIDHFKDINDTLGHPIGDSVLIKVGECIKSSVRETDIVARFGGDEFAILQADLADSSDAGSLAVKIRAALAVPIQLGGNVVHMTASIGIATYAPEISKPEDMLAQADVALYRAKEEGRDQYRFHSEALDVEVRERVAVAEELRLAIDREELELYYQPQVELSTGQIVGMEALIRWNHPTRGLLLPSAFIAVAEKTGTVAAIGHWVLDRACQQMSQWRKDGIAPPTLAVNISLTQISAANEFIQFVTETLSKWSLAPVDLEFDVTESMLARATLAQNDVLERLHKLGVKIAIDDFGTKFSTLDYLKIYRVNRLKIPQALIAAAAKDPESAAIVRAIAGIARELNIDVVAQGVETEAQWSYLTATSPATKVQGFFYSEPVPAARAKALLTRGRIGPSQKRREPAALKRH